MKDFFKGYYRLNEYEFRILWKKATFVFDTNVLLNLYRYETPTRDSLLDVMKRLADRIWIPYHVGLEYQRNRLKVIAEQCNRYSEVKKIVADSVDSMQGKLDGLQLEKRHSHINPEKLLKAVQKAQQKFFEELEPLENMSITVTSDDPIRDRLDDLFEGRIGSGPEEQTEIDEIQNEGELRFEKGIPPGFKDSSKDSKKSDEFTHSGLIYQRKFGDLIVWKQIIKYASKEELKDLIFITDDSKSDWWWKVKSNGSKTIGVQPELTDEIVRESGVERFYMYNMESFLNYANDQLDTQVAKETIDEVREVSVQKSERLIKHRSIRRLVYSAEKAVFNWLSDRFQPLEPHRGFPDFISIQDNLKFGFEVKLIRNPRMVHHIISELTYRSYYLLNEDKYHEMAIILVMLNVGAVSEVFHRLKRIVPKIKSGFKIVIGVGDMETEEEISRFIPYADINPNDTNLTLPGFDED